MRRVRRANLLLHLGELAVDALQGEAEGATAGSSNVGMQSFHREVESHLGPIALESDSETPALENRGIYLVVELRPTGL